MQNILIADRHKPSRQAGSLYFCQPRLFPFKPHSQVAEKHYCARVETGCQHSISNSDHRNTRFILLEQMETDYNITISWRVKMKVTVSGLTRISYQILVRGRRAVLLENPAEWILSDVFLFFPPSLPTDTLLIHQSQGERGARSVWESVGGRAARMGRQRKKVCLSIKKAILAEWGEWIHSPMACFVMMPNSCDSTASAVSLTHFCLDCPLPHSPPHNLALYCGWKGEDILGFTRGAETPCMRNFSQKGNCNS